MGEVIAILHNFPLGQAYTCQNRLAAVVNGHATVRYHFYSHHFTAFMDITFTGHERVQSMTGVYSEVYYHRSVERLVTSELSIRNLKASGDRALKGERINRFATRFQRSVSLNIRCDGPILPGDVYD